MTVKYFFILSLIFFASVNIFAQESHQSRRSKILSERIEKERAEIVYDLRVSQLEMQYLGNNYLNGLIKKQKLEFLIKSSEFMRDNCIPFDSRCRNLYNMSIAYLKDEIRVVERDLLEQENIISDAKNRVDSLTERLQYIEEGIVIEEKERRVSAAIPELKKAFKCNRFRGWNHYRGVFIDPEDMNDLPFTMFVKDVVKLDLGGYLIALEAGEHIINFTYVEKPLVKKGEVTGMGSPVFQGSAGNPVMPDKVLVFINKNNRFVNPGFMCR